MITKKDMQDRTKAAKAKQLEVSKAYAEKWLDETMEEDFYAAAARGETSITFHVPKPIQFEALRKVLGERGFRAEPINCNSTYYKYNLPEPQLVCYWFF